MNRYNCSAFLEESAKIISEEEAYDLIPCVVRDIPNAIRGLGSILNEQNHDKVAMAQMILNACFLIVKRCI